MVARACEAEEDDGGNILGRHHPGERLSRPSVPVREREVRRNASRADVRAADSLLAQLVVERARQTDLAEFRGAVHGFAGQAAAAGLGRDVMMSPSRCSTRCGTDARIA